SFSASAFTASSLKSASTTAAPASANACAVARPMPAAAPVTSATLPVKSNGLFITNSFQLFASSRVERSHVNHVTVTSFFVDDLVPGLVDLAPVDQLDFRNNSVLRAVFN